MIAFTVNEGLRIVPVTTTHHSTRFTIIHGDLIRITRM